MNWLRLPFADIMDPFNPEARKFVFEQMKENYMKYGIKTFWLDEAEPERHTQDISTRFGYHDGTDAQIGLAVRFCVIFVAVLSRTFWTHFLLLPTLALVGARRAADGVRGPARGRYR